MIVKCESCMAEYSIDEARIKPQGSKVRCSGCGHVFVVHRDAPPALVLDDEAQSPEPPSVSAEGAPEAEEGYASSKPSPPARRPSTPARTEEPPREEDGQPAQDFDWENLDLGEVRGHSPTSVYDEPPGLDAEAGGYFEGEFEFSPESEEAGTIEIESTSGGQKEAEKKPYSPPPEPPSSNWAGRGMKGYTPSYEELTFIEQPGTLPVRRHPHVVRKVVKRRRETPPLTTFFVALVAAGIIAAVAIIASTLGVIPRETGDKIAKAVAALFGGGEEKPLVVVSEDSGAWLSTRNGYMFVVSGFVKNESPFVVNYIEIESEFVSGGEKLFSQRAYAGNTFTEEELKTLTTAQIEERLARRNGDIDFRNTQKLAGLNFGVRPGETVPFFTVFPSEGKVLGLRYRVRVAGFERGPRVAD